MIILIPNLVVSTLSCKHYISYLLHRISRFAHETIAAFNNLKLELKKMFFWITDSTRFQNNWYASHYKKNLKSVNTTTTSIYHFQKYLPWGREWPEINFSLFYDSFSFSLLSMQCTYYSQNNFAIKLRYRK